MVKSTYCFISFVACLVLLLLVPEPVRANKLELTTEVSPTSGTSFDDYTFRVTVVGEHQGAPPVLSGGEDFTLTLVGPQSSIHIVNGEVDARVTYVYKLAPKRQGNLHTPAAELNIGQKKLQAPAIRVRVDDTLAPRLDSNRDLILTQKLTARSAFVGEQVTNTIELLSPYPIVKADFDSLTYDGFWKEQIGKEQSIERYLKGKQFKGLSLRHALFPLRQGELLIPQRRIRATVRKQSRRHLGLDRFDIFGRSLFSLSRPENVSAVSQPLKLAVKPLPALSGDRDVGTQSVIPVGQTSLSAGYSTEEISLGESKTLTFTVKSLGNIQPLKDLPIEFPSSLKVYEEHPQTKASLQQGKLLYSKTFTLSVVAIREGEVHIPPIRLIYFDPTPQQYRTAKTREIRFAVKPGLATDPGSAGLPSLAPSEMLLDQSDTQHQNGEENVDNLPRYAPEHLSSRVLRYFSLSSILLILTCTAFFLFIGATLFRSMYRKRKRTVALSRLGQSHNPSELRSSLLAYFNREVLAQKQPLEKQAVIRELEDKYHNRDLLFSVQSTFDEIESLIYSEEEYSQEVFVEAKSRAEKLARSFVN